MHESETYLNKEVVVQKQTDVGESASNETDRLLSALKVL